MNFNSSHELFIKKECITFKLSKATLFLGISFRFITSPAANGLAPIMALRDLISVDGPARREVPVSAMALQPPEQYLDAFPLTLTL